MNVYCNGRRVGIYTGYVNSSKIRMQRRLLDDSIVMDEFSVVEINHQIDEVEIFKDPQYLDKIKEYFCMDKDKTRVTSDYANMRKVITEKVIKVTIQEHEDIFNSENFEPVDD